MKLDRAAILATVQIIFGIIMFTSNFWLSHSQHETALYIYGFAAVLLGIATWVLLAAKK